MFKISLFTVGGGFAILAVADEVFARRRHWTREGEMVDQLSVFQMVPGIIAGHTAVYIGNKMAGFIGVFCSVAGAILPSFLIFLGVAMGYQMIPVENVYLGAVFGGLRAALAGVIAAMALRCWKKNVEGVRGLMTFLLAGIFLILKVEPAWVILGAAACGAAAAFPKRTGQTFASSFWIIPLVFLKYGAIAFGGGYVLMPLYEADFVGASAPWLQLSHQEFADMMAITQMTPGPIGINAATFFGYRLAGVWGSFTATFSMILPGLVLLVILLRSLERWQKNRYISGALKGIRPVTMALMVLALYSFLRMSVWTASSSDLGASFHPLAALIVGAVTILLYRKVWGVIPLVFSAAGFSLIVQIVKSLI